MDVKSSFLSSYTQRTQVSSVLRCTCNKSRRSLPSRPTSINQLVTGLHCAKHSSSCTRQTILFSHLSIWVASGSTCCHELWESSVGLGRPSISIGNLFDLFALSTSNRWTRRPPLTSSSSNITPGISGPHPYFLRTYHNRIPVQQNLIIITNWSEDFYQHP